jgi:hypothetical protein
MGSSDSSIPLFTVDCKVGRLVEARLYMLHRVDDVTSFRLAMRDAFRRAGPAVRHLRRLAPREPCSRPRWPTR